MNLKTVTLLIGVCRCLWASEPARAPNSPVNQVFQFMQSGTRSGWADGATTNATAYLWIPEKCRRLRGLLVMGSNVPEHMLVGHPEIRAVCAANDLGIIWSTPSFWYYKAKNEDQNVAGFLQQLLDGLAKTTGYPEVATVPWLPMGESGHLLMVDALVEAAPDRCMAGIWIKNAHLPPKNRVTPALVVYGSAQEWGQDKVNMRTRWNDLKSYDNVLKQRKEHPDWPLSFVVDGGSGHFDVSGRLVNYFAHYIDLVAKARLPKDGSAAMKPVDMTRGFLADLPLPGREKYPVTLFPKVAANARAVPWFFDRASAVEAQAIGAINWKAETQIPAFQDASGKIAPFNFNGISGIVPEMEADGITFGLRAVMLDKIPENFVGAGEPLAKAPSTPALEWLCGAVEPAGDGRFRVALDRTYRQQAIYIAARNKGTTLVRDAVQPVHIDLKPNGEGKPQTITFHPIADVKAGKVSVPLEAQSNSGLPVRFFVVAGPAIVHDGKLVFTKIPPRSQFPITVTVAAWQWGRSAEPKVKTAETVRQTFRIVH
jgi:hypothetical protein